MYVRQGQKTKLEILKVLEIENLFSFLCASSKNKTRLEISKVLVFNTFLSSKTHFSPRG